MKKAKLTLAILVVLALAVFVLAACEKVDDPVCQHRDADDNGKCDKCGEAFDDGMNIAESSEGLEFRLNEDGETYTVTGIDSCADTDIIIGLHNGAKVTSIGDGAFNNCDNLTSIVIPDSVISIGDGAFIRCSSLTSVTIGKGVTSIGWDAFRECTSLESVVIPDSVISIGNNAFTRCSSLTSVTIGKGVTSIGSDAFYRCHSLTSITVDNNNSSYKSIDGNLYSKDGKILLQYAMGNTATSFTIPDGVTNIRSWAFAWCENLTSVVIPISVTSIDNAAFYYSYNLTIYCEAASQPSDWDSSLDASWNTHNCPVVWGYTGD